MRKLIFILSFFALSQLFFLCNSSYSIAFTEEELSLQRLQDRMNSLEKNMATMQQELYRSNKSGKTKQKPSEEPIGTDEEKTRAFNGKIEELEHSVNTLAAKLDKIIADIDFRLGALEKKPAAVASAENKTTDAVNQNASLGNAKPEPEATQAVENAANAQTAPQDKAPEKKTAATPGQPAKSDTAAQYDKAFEFLRNSKYDEAETCI